MLIPIIQWNNEFDNGGAHKLGLLGEVYVFCPSIAEVSLESVPLKTLDCQIGPFTSTNQIDDAIVWLDKGATKAVFILNPNDDWQQTLGKLEAIPRDRLAILMNIQDSTDFTLLASVLNEVRSVAGTVVLHYPPEVKASEDELLQQIEILQQARGKEGKQDFLQLIMGSPSWTHEEVGKLHKLSPQVDCQCPAFIPCSETSTPQDSLDAASALISCARTDRPDELYTTVVTDASGVALGLVYSNNESIRSSLECGRGVYWSRSRGGLWRKGDTSGAWQELLSVALDCDSDALCYRVIQHGTPPAFCHLNRRNCWTENKGFSKLEQTLKSRLENAPEGSYTKRLFNDPDLLRNKLLEEVQELVEAETSEHIASEAADVMYFLMARCAAGGVGLKDIEKDLDMKSRKLKRRPGNAKAHRIAAAEKVVGKHASDQS